MTGPADLPPAGVPPVEAIAFFRSKGYAIGFAWEDVFRAEHVRAFTVAKAMTRDLLEDIRAAVDTAIAEGSTLADFKRTLRPVLEARGWWGRKRMIDPLTGENKRVQLGSPRRLKTIFDTNMRTAYQAGKWERIQRTARALPYLEYTSVMDGRERPEHRAWNGVILPVDDPWWETHYPPCDWNCRCSVVQRSARMLERAGKTVTKAPPRFPDVPWTNSRTGETGMIERGLGKGWDYNVGAEYLRGLSPSPLPPGFRGPAAGGDETIGAAVRFNDREQQLLDRFLDAMDVPEKVPGKQREAIWTDREGWPLAITRGWFIAGGGKRGAQAKLPAAPVLDRIAATLRSPGAISWAWVRGANGRALLMRRYTRIDGEAAMQVDIGAAGWRWRIVPADVVAAGYRTQPRDAKGRWSRKGDAALQFCADAISDPQFKGRFNLGRVSAEAVSQLDTIGIGGSFKGKGKTLLLDAHVVRHIINKHGKDRLPQKPVSIADIARSLQVLNTATLRRGTPAVAHSGAQTVYGSAKIGSEIYSLVVHSGKKRLMVHTMHKR